MVGLIFSKRKKIFSSRGEAINNNNNKNNNENKFLLLLYLGLYTAYFSAFILKANEEGICFDSIFLFVISIILLIIIYFLLKNIENGWQ